jgi:[CysO sulfur-carrier protein]-S-L-cysteine hydrolase
MSGSRPPKAVLEIVYAEAIRAFPAECCGFLFGPRVPADEVTGAHPCRNAQEAGDHPTAADRGAETAYVIAGDDLLALVRSLDGPEPAKIIYHSHPNGRAYFSATDQAVAADPWGEGPMYPCLQMVVGVTAERVVEAALFAWQDGAFVEVDRWSVDWR